MNQDVNNSVPIDEEEIGTRIRVVADRYLSRQAAADAAGVSLISLRRYINGEVHPPFATLARLALPQGVSLHWLATGEGEQDERTAVATTPCPCLDTLGNPVDLEEFVFIPRYSVRAAAGCGQWPEDESPRFSMAFRRYWVEIYLRANPDDLSVIAVDGDSMEGVLNDRDVILVNHADRDPRGSIYVLRIDGHLVVKQVQRLPGGILEVSSSNPAYKPFTVELGKVGDDFDVIGRVVWFGRQV